MTEPIDWEEEEDRIAPRFLAAGDPTGWFEELYAGGESGRLTMPFSRRDPHPLLAEWAEARGLAGAGRRALIVGCGLGADAEYIAGRGFRTTAFDISEAAVRIARRRHEGSPVDYAVANLLDPPPGWARSFDLVVEIFTVQALPESVREKATAAVASLLAPGGTLFVVMMSREEGTVADGPPWVFTRSQMDGFAVDGVKAVSIEGQDGRWIGEFTR